MSFGAALVLVPLAMVLPEQDAADVMRWAAHPEAVRELLRYDPVREEYDQEACAACSEVAGDYPEVTSHLAACTVAAAWRALDDPRGAADVEWAHEEALGDARQLPRTIEWSRALERRQPQPAAWLVKQPR